MNPPIDLSSILAAATGPAGVMKAARRLEPLLKDSPTVAVLSSFTAELLRPYFLVEAARAGLPMQMWPGPFGQLEQLVLDPASALYTARPAAVVMMVRLGDVDRWLADEAVELGPAAVAARLSSLRERVIGLANEFRRRSTAPVLVANFALEEPASPFDASDPDGLVHLLADANRALARGLRQLTDVHVLDYAGTVASTGVTRFADRKLWAMSKAVGSAEGHTALARQLALSTRAVLRPAHKVIVVDLDNTIWGGVLGDDGAAALKLGGDGSGGIYRDFQAALLGYRRRGLLLAVASKNDEAVAREAIATHPEMVLKPEHFAAMAISWEPKWMGLEKLAKQLNLGLDSFVFVDDNPVERAEIRSRLPMVHVVELPQDPADYVAALRTAPGLESPRIEAEDRTRAAMVHSDAARDRLQERAPSVEEFLNGLGMVAEVGLVDASTLGRVHQLITKTNQFNLTTRRHALDEVRRLGEAPEAAVAWLRLSDRFGDLGIVCVGILRATAGSTWEVDTLLMSCRVMGRHVESAFLSYLGELARARGGTRLEGCYVPTAKNAPVAHFYEAHGFTMLGGERWGAELVPGALPWPPAIARKEKA